MGGGDSVDEGARVLITSDDEAGVLQRPLHGTEAREYSQGIPYMLKERFYGVW
uniref:Uncharacterized protein n=1 Tax=Oryza sativa subsp. japonica TaxID=39947 RepID=Q6ZB31_ORYSJ|nr:hypothetical protein [Oryza sativa Japonica Group]BAD05376.1 hypothetical protein [Oryza sativa Japonica Group]